MSYEFKKLSDVNIIESMSENTNVLVEENGEIVKISANDLVPEDVVTKAEMDEAIAAIPEPVTSWNDLTDKPFGEKTAATYFVENFTIPSRDNNSSIIIPSDSIVNSAVLSSNEIITVTYDGQTYNCKVSSSDTEGMGYLDYFAGNRYLLGSYYPDSGEPFLIKKSGATGSVYVYTNNNSEHVISAYTLTTAIIPLDEKFIPNTIARVDEVVKSVNGIEPDENGDVTVNIPEGFSGDYNDLFNAPVYDNQNVITLVDQYGEPEEYDYSSDQHLIYLNVAEPIELQEGMKLKITYQGEEYITIVNSSKLAWFDPDGFGTEDTYLSYWFRGYKITRGSGNLSSGHILIEYIESEDFKQLDEKFIPETIARKSDIPNIYELHPITRSGSWNDLEDKPLGKGVESTIFTGNATSDNSISNSSGVCAHRVLDVALQGEYGTIPVTKDGQVLSVEDFTFEGAYCSGEYVSYECGYSAWNGSIVVFSVSAPCQVRMYGGDWGTFDITEAGTYVSGWEGGGTYGEYSFTVNKEVMLTLDPIYLSTTVPVIQSAQIGQTIAVKSVDENGKPTEWEAVNVGVGVKSWNDLEDKPFYDYSKVLYEGPVVLESGMSMMMLNAEIIPGIEYTIVFTDVEHSKSIGDRAVATERDVSTREWESEIVGKYVYDISYGGTLYVYSESVLENPEYYKVTVQYTNYEDVGSATLDSRYLPKAAAVADAAGETPTAAEFNALLTALRNAGYLAT